MISKKFLQNKLIANNKKIIERFFTNKLINLSSRNFATHLNLNFSHVPNALPHEALKINAKKNSSSKLTLSDLLLSKLSKK